MFLNDDFLLTTDTARLLFHQHAKAMPIIDYHCHLDPKEIYEDRAFSNLTEALLLRRSLQMAADACQRGSGIAYYRRCLGL